MIADNIKQVFRTDLSTRAKTFVLLAADLASDQTYTGYFIAKVRFINDDTVPAGHGYGHVAIVSSPDRQQGEEVRYRQTGVVGIYRAEDGRHIVLHERVVL